MASLRRGSFEAPPEYESSFSRNQVAAQRALAPLVVSPTSGFHLVSGQSNYFIGFSGLSAPATFTPPTVGLVPGIQITLADLDGSAASHAISWAVQSGQPIIYYNGENLLGKFTSGTVEILGDGFDSATWRWSGSIWSLVAIAPGILSAAP